MKPALANDPRVATSASVVAAVGPEDDDVLRIAWVQASVRRLRLVVCTVVDDEKEYQATYDALEQRVRTLVPPDADVVLDVRLGDRVQAVLGSALAHDAALVVLGATAQREGVIARFLSPSLLTALTRAAPCPVLVTRSTPGTSRILAATDLGDPSRPVLRAAVEEVQRVGGTVITVHCVAPMPLAGSQSEAETNAETNAAVRAELERIVAEEGLPVGDESVRVEQGQSAPTIVKLAQELAVDLIIIGTHGRSGVSRLLLGSVAESVLRDATCNVLVVRQGAQTPIEATA